MNYIIHGTLNDYIDYKELIEFQAKEAFKEYTYKVVKVRKSNRNSRGQFRGNVSVNLNRCDTLTKRRKIITKRNPQGKFIK